MKKIILLILIAYNFPSLAQKEIEFKVQNKVSDFILKHASFPKTYKPISFEYFLILNSEDTSSVEDRTSHDTYSITHTFKIKNNKGKTVQYQLRFDIDHNFLIMEIKEYQDPDTICTHCYPPQLDWWFKNLGRKITLQEKIELGIKQ
ncbi:MAG: hypothetical protein U0U66_08580 [Cytophagaceae bacterium]